jgi:SET domain-containing protein
MEIKYIIDNKKSVIDGIGAFAGEKIPGRKKIGDLGGKIISLSAARKKADQIKRVAIVEFGNGQALDASIDPNQLRYVNHSCFPNTYMRVCYRRVEFYSLRPIKKGEELTCNYGPTHHDGKLKCNCGSPNCKGYL